MTLWGPPVHSESVIELKSLSSSATVESCAAAAGMAVDAGAATAVEDRGGSAIVTLFALFCAAVPCSDMAGGSKGGSATNTYNAAALRLSNGWKQNWRNLQQAEVMMMMSPEEEWWTRMNAGQG